MEHHNLSLLLNITVALVWAFAGGLLARRLGLPSLVGYLLAGVAIGPFTPGEGRCIARTPACTGGDIGLGKCRRSTFQRWVRLEASRLVAPGFGSHRG